MLSKILLTFFSDSLSSQPSIFVAFGLEVSNKAVVIGLIMKFFIILIFIQFWTKSLSLPADICEGTGVYDILPHPDNCVQYVFCLMGTPTIIDCEENHIFDKDSKTCEPGKEMTFN